MRFRFYLFVMSALVLSACTPQEQAFVADAQNLPAISKNIFTTSDGAMLPYRAWLPRQTPRAVIIALHGFNDYSNAFSEVGPYFVGRGIAMYAYDQRGFGASINPGIWASGENLTRDLVQFSEQVAKRHPHTPLYILGESMGGAVAIKALANAKLPVKGLVLVAPAVWGGPAMNPVFSGMLWMSAHMFPSWELTGSDLKILASNNIPLLQRMSYDPLIIKATRVDAVYGLVNLMDAAYENLPGIGVPTLLIYGGNDQVIPRDAIEIALARFTVPLMFSFYPNSYHMMMRDLQGREVMADVASWTLNPKRPLSHGNARLVVPQGK